MKIIFVVDNEKKNNSLIFFYRKIVFVVGKTAHLVTHNRICKPPHDIMAGAVLLCGGGPISETGNRSTFNYYCYTADDFHRKSMPNMTTGRRVTECRETLSLNHSAACILRCCLMQMFWNRLNAAVSFLSALPFGVTFYFNFRLI